MSEQRYAGFWIRVAASLIDTILLMVVLVPLLTSIYGSDYWLEPNQFSGVWDVILNYVLPAVVVIVFWLYRSATPGKMILKLKIIDAQTGGKPSAGQLVGRYFAYYVSAFALLLGFIWVAFDQRKQGWHDKLAGTVVVHQPSTPASGVEHDIATPTPPSQ